MTVEKNVTDDDAMRSSANALTKKLYLTVMDVFGNYVGNDEDDYNNMLETLRSKRVQNHKCTTPAKSDGTRGIIATKLLEGYALHGDVCDKCVTPLMSYLGTVTCVVCKKVEEELKTKLAETGNSSNDVELTLAATTESEQSEEDEEDLVNKQLNQFNERRSQATQVYTAKILSGYVMQDQLCSKCDMPMMKHKDSVECVFCPKEVEHEASELVQDGTNEAVKSDIVVGKNEDHIKAIVAAAKLVEKTGQVKKLSQAEIIAERLRGAKAKGHDENTESELEKAESELLKMMETLRTKGNQGGEVSESLQAYFSRKKQDRTAGKRLKEAEDGIIEAEEVALQEQRGGMEGGIRHALRVDNEPIFATTANETENGGFNENEIIHSNVPPTPQFEPSISCSIGNSFFPSLKNMFASTSCPTNRKVECHESNETNLSTGRLEAKKRIAMLVAEGWEVSADSCPQCDLPLFTNSSGHVINCIKRCVMCGPITKNDTNDGAQGSKGLTKQHEEAEEDISKKMMNRIMEGWSIVEGTHCPSCNIPTMFDPKTRLAHCIACEAQKPGVLPALQHEATNMSSGDGQGTAALHIQAMQTADPSKELQADITKTMVNRIMAGWIVIEGSKCPSCYMPTMFDTRTNLTHCVACGVLQDSGMLVSMPQKATGTNTEGGAGSIQRGINILGLPPNPDGSGLFPLAAHMVQNNLKIETSSEPSYNNQLPDPTVSMYEFRSQYGGKRMDPEPSMHVGTHSKSIQHNTGAPTPAAKPVRYMNNEPTPNMHAVRNKLCASAAPKLACYTACDPPTSMHFATYSEPIQHNTSAPTPTTKTVRYMMNEPTPSMQAVRNKPYVSAPPEPTLYTASDPTPSMQTFRGNLINPNPTPLAQDFESELYITSKDEPIDQKKMGNNPTPAVRKIRYEQNEPTLTMQAVQNKINELESSLRVPSTYATEGEFNYLTVSTANPRKTRAVDPTPSNSGFST
mmetsp:Transcript_57648/g.122309  ORF Transcript_57648/g.122309 Transcript_57648/m.122309 type:complete len:972 (+) Transcript_57648:198-3113(+)|eukprot:CAMPEP_0172528734 /NCGR_PEP_ID=MMETSP1067-20121228/3026_1 /TAXON_ID=265564 ORGANISM="Thalassiosira punctigera, Strain Tpunct2005C2" /NCGR_SAMPLE_ID=MMETSP1067 /ASSEMBLY_ACC=CAM_ASM_000444 /LENGTH=971 /DNA_ID=CAMNT_0013312695 /DNA_START=195 /DNA_END=3110 /DNA_ORIENTATION=+